MRSLTLLRNHVKRKRFGDDRERIVGTAPPFGGAHTMCAPGGRFANRPYIYWTSTDLSVTTQ